MHIRHRDVVWLHRLESLLVFQSELGLFYHTKPFRLYRFTIHDLSTGNEAEGEIRLKQRIHSYSLVHYGLGMKSSKTSVYVILSTFYRYLWTPNSTNLKNAICCLRVVVKTIYDTFDVWKDNIYFSFLVFAVWDCTDKYLNAKEESRITIQPKRNVVYWINRTFMCYLWRQSSHWPRPFCYIQS